MLRRKDTKSLPNPPTHQVEALFWPTACCNPFRFCVLAGMVLDHAPQFVPLLK